MTVKAMRFLSEREHRELVHRLERVKSAERVELERLRREFADDTTRTIRCRFPEGGELDVPIGRITTSIGRGVWGLDELIDLSHRGTRCGAEISAVDRSQIVLLSWEW